MSIATDQLQPPPTAEMAQQAASSHVGDHGSVGPIIAVLAVIAILGVIAGMIGRLLSSRRLFGLGQCDVEGWIERKCSSCLDGKVGEVRLPAATSGGDVPVAMPIPPEIKEEQGPRDHNLPAVGGV